MAAPTGLRFLHEKAYVNGKWVDSNSGKTFDGMLIKVMRKQIFLMIFVLLNFLL